MSERSELVVDDASASEPGDDGAGAQPRSVR